MGPKLPCAKYQYVITPAGPKILPVEDPLVKDEESPADYNTGGYLPVKVNDTFKSGRYRVVRKLGWGHFSTVWLVKDTHTHRHSALKIVKSASRYAETARDEIKLLSDVASYSSTHPGRSHIVSFLDSFSYQGPEASHVCIVFEPLGENLLAVIERNKKKGVPRTFVKLITKQILLGLQYLHDECHLIHTDIKPENILISIPDIEAHIQSELSRSPSPTSHRVGIPLPTKSRAGVSIPHSQQRARRQVQIFDSQPLASPSRSVDRPRNAHTSLSMSARHGNSGSGGNSTHGNYVAQMHLSKLTGSGSNTASGTAKSLSSNAAKFPSASAPRGDHLPPSKSDFRLDSGQIVPSDPKPISASKSSSSSSVASTLASTITGSSSMVSTPPTSLSYSFGNAVAGLMGFTGTGDQPRSGYWDAAAKRGDDDMEGLSVPVNKRNEKGKVAVEDQLDDASTSWRDSLGIPGSWKDKLSASISSSCKSSSGSYGKSGHPQVQSNGHLSNGHSRISSTGFWKDPGTAAPAPAVVVSAVVGADGEEGAGNYFDLANGVTRSLNTSASTSGTATAAQPSRNGSPNTAGQTSSKKIISTSNATVNSASDIPEVLSTDFPAAVLQRSSTTSSLSSSNVTPSLLTQTAPPRPLIPPSLPSPSSHLQDIRPPPSHHVSQLSAHMYSRPSISHNSDSSPQNQTIISQTNTFDNYPTNTQSPSRIAIASTSFTPTSVTSPPAAPPPTPVTPTSESSFCPGLVSTSTVPIPIADSERPPAPEHPPIMIKIADLGNATPSSKHYTDDIQTRQYRAPEAILGKCDWDATADIWSVACVTFELLTGEYLFDPRGQGELFSKDDDHMAQIIELLGDFPLEVKMGGKYSREVFDHNGALRYIRTLKPWPLKRVMIEKYHFTERDSVALCKFLLPMLAVDRRKRVNARDVVDHGWLNPTLEDDMADGEW